ncbi:MAG: prepilin-type N-terminal cleavage/methylation domain-containing protein [Smithella sp.]|jgi:prepilin-type N-terminal cleavage/methylation domain-containing protein
MKTGKNIFEYGFTLIEVIITLVVIAVVAAMIAVYFGTSYTQSSVPISRLMAAENLNKIMEKITGDYNNAPTTWSPGTAYTSGTAPPTVVLPTEANRNGYQYVCSSAGTSGATEPNWASYTTIGSTVPDGSVTWTNGGLIPPNPWAVSTAYSLNQVVYPANGYQYICTVAGTSGTTQPLWPTTIGSTVPDGSVTWKCYQPLVALQTKIGAEGGPDQTQTFNGVSISYRVIQNRFITFDTTNTENDSCTSSSCNNIYGVNVYGTYLKVTIGLPMAASPRTADTLTTLFVRR